MKLYQTTALILASTFALAVAGCQRPTTTGSRSGDESTMASNDARQNPTGSTSPYGATPPQAGTTTGPGSDTGATPAAPPATSQAPGAMGSSDTAQAPGATSGSTAAQPPETSSVLGDSTITAKVKSAIIAEPELSALDIKVNTDNGVVTLSGAVDNSQKMEKAAQVAQSVSGVKAVNNQLSVKSAS